MVGLSQETLILIFLFAIAGSFINIPLGKRRVMLVEQPYFFGLFKKSYMAVQGISINLGGAIIPILLASYLFLQAPLVPTLFATVFMVFVSNIFSKYIPGRGVALSPFLAALLAVFFAFIVASHEVARVSFVSGIFGVLIGADILRIPKIQKEGEFGVLSIGGAGVFDGIFLIGIIATLLVRI